METIRVLIVDDHAVVREGLRFLISTEPGLEMVGEAADGDEAIYMITNLQPDVVLLDLVMPHKTGLEVIEEVTRRNLRCRILVLSSFSDDEKVFPAIKAGAFGYLLKDTATPVLIQAIRDVHRGESALHPAIARMLIKEIHRPTELTPTTDPLTEREMEVLRWLARGMTNQNIADELRISERTVRTHISSILAKLHLANRTQAALYALREGLASLNDGL